MKDFKLMNITLDDQSNFSNLDIQLNSTGNPVYVTKTNKLIQKAKKIILTDLGSDKFAINYGSLINKMIGKKMQESFIKTRLGVSVYNALERQITLDAAEGQLFTQDQEEVLDSINYVDISPSTSSLTTWDVFANINSKKRNALDVPVQI